MTLTNSKILIGPHVGEDVLDPKTFEEFREEVLASERRHGFERNLLILKHDTPNCECGKQGSEVWLVCIPEVVNGPNNTAYGMNKYSVHMKKYFVHVDEPGFFLMDEKGNMLHNVSDVPEVVLWEEAVETEQARRLWQQRFEWLAKQTGNSSLADQAMKNIK